MFVNKYFKTYIKSILLENPEKPTSNHFVYKQIIEHVYKINISTKHFEKQNMISDDELKKYYLDKTGKYIPKLKQLEK